MSYNDISALMKERRARADEMRALLRAFIAKNPAQLYVIGYMRDGTRANGRTFFRVLSAAEIPDALALDVVYSISSDSHGARVCLRFSPLAMRVDETRMNGAPFIDVQRQHGENIGNAFERQIIDVMALNVNTGKNTLFNPDAWTQRGVPVQIKTVNATIAYLDDLQ